MERLADLPDDMVLLTQITMEAAEDTAFLDAMRKAHIRGALVGVESVTAEGLKAIYKDFNLAGDALVERLQIFKQHGVHVLGSFIFGLPTDTAETFDATAAVAQRRNAGTNFMETSVRKNQRTSITPLRVPNPSSSRNGASGAPTLRPSTRNA
jgi:radical SAM superfamily enzyme YgiQ (UPF0313 family)